MKDYQQEAFHLMSLSLDRNSKWFSQDYDDLKAHYSKASRELCERAIERYWQLHHITEAEVQACKSGIDSLFN